MQNHELFDLTPPTSIRKMLSRLSDYCHGNATREGFIRPEISIWVQGREARGYLSKIGTEDDIEMLLLIQGEPMSTLVMVPVAHIAMLTIHNARELATTISFGAVARPLDETPIGALAFEKQLKSTAERISNDTGASLTFSCNAGTPFNTILAANAVDIATAFAEACSKIAVTDTVGKSAVQSITSVEIVNSPHTEALVAKQAAGVTITCNLTEALDVRFREQLLSGLESVL